MLAGFLIAALVLGGLVLGWFWLVANRDTPDAVDGEPEERFSDSMRILRSDVADYIEAQTGPEVSTPLTRRAELKEVRLISRAASVRRARTAVALMGVLLATIAGCLFGPMPWWSVLMPVGLLGVFMAGSRWSVVAMHRRFDARVAAATAGYDEDEYTQAIAIEEPEPSVEFSVDLSAPQTTGALWDPIPVTAPTYVSKPLVPRTVRTIDLSAPVAGPTVVPTADHPDAVAQEADDAPAPDNITEFPRAVGN